MEHLNFDFVKKVLTRLSALGFDSSEAVLGNDHLTEMEVDVSSISLLRNTESDSLILRAIQGGRYGSVSLSQLDDNRLQMGISKLQEQVQSAPIDSARAFAPQPLVATNEMGPLEPMHYAMHNSLSRFLSAVSEAYPECVLKQALLRYHRTRKIRVNSVGHETDTTEGYYSLGVRFLSKRNGKTSQINFNGSCAADLDTDLLEWGGIRRALESSVREINLTPFHGRLQGRMVIAPEALFILMGHWLSNLRDEKILSGISPFRSSLEQPVCSPLITFGIEPRGPGFARHEFLTDDGYGSEPSMIVENGKLKSFMISDYAARKTSLPRGENSGLNWVFGAGKTPLHELFSGVEKGLMLGRISGGVPAANGEFSGIAKNSFLIEGGYLSRPVSEAVISGNIFEMFNSITAVSKDRSNDGIALIPWLGVDGMRVKGR
jgi:PmbA protein